MSQLKNYFQSYLSIVSILMVINIISFIIQWIIPGYTEAFLLHKGDIFTRPYTLLTSMFLHGDISHLLFNMYVLYIFGSIIEQRIGQKRFLTIYLISGLIAALISNFVYTAALGASGAIMGIMGIMIILMPNLQVLLFFIIPLPLWIAGILIALIDIFGIFAPSGIANIAHLVGLTIGLIYGYLLKDKRKKHHQIFKNKAHLDNDDIDQYLRFGRI